jgi:hypothetical protein
MNDPALRFVMGVAVLGALNSCGGSVQVPRQVDSGEADTGASGCFISASNYDQSCSVDSDCIGFIDGFETSLGPGGLPVQSANYCQAICICGGDAINKNAVAQYEADVAKTPLGSGALQPLCAGCPFSTPPCCQGGQCAKQCIGQVEADSSVSVDAEIRPFNPSIDGGVLCGIETGPLDSGGGTQLQRWCMPPEVCAPFNGGWACCTEQGGAGLSICIAPTSDDAG